MRFFLLFILVSFIALSCQNNEPPAASANVKRYQLKGKVVSVDRAKKKAEIDHQEIPGYMPRMTMSFPIKEDWVWENLVPGVEVHAELVVDETADIPYWLEKIGIVALPNPDQPAIEEKVPEQIGKEVPNVPLTDHDGKPFTFKDLRGKTVAVTFIYRECPLPEFCIKMSQYFSDMANTLAEDPDGKEKVRLVSISFDPERDTPEKLKQYGLGYLGRDAKDDLTIWRLAVGKDSDIRTIADFFGLEYKVDENDKTQFGHNLRTAVISPEGKVTHLFTGSRWTPDELMSAVKGTVVNDK